MSVPVIILNFSHPLTPAQAAQIVALAGEPISQTVEVAATFDAQTPYGDQLAALLDHIALTPAQWQSGELLLVLPSLNTIAALVLAAVHGRSGGFPPVVRLRPAPGSVLRRYEVAELLDLQRVREAMRVRNSQPTD